RQILVDRARKKHRLKRGGLINDVPLEDAMHLSTETVEIDLVGLDDALKRLENMDPQQARIVELKYFGGLSIQETAEIVGISPATVKRDWNIARAWLLNELSL
ncbi:MAG: sigma-70 family RNA polymerase sigma factor, partial [Candidatus Binatia bacterium]